MVTTMVAVVGHNGDDHGAVVGHNGDDHGGGSGRTQQIRGQSRSVLFGSIASVASPSVMAHQLVLCSAHSTPLGWPGAQMRECVHGRPTVKHMRTHARTPTHTYIPILPPTHTHAGSRTADGLQTGTHQVMS